MPSKQAYTVHLYKTNGVIVLEGHNSPFRVLDGEQPYATYKVNAPSQVGAVRAALVAATETLRAPEGKPEPSGTYTLSIELGSQLDLTLKRLCEEDDTHTAADVVHRAVNLYATLRKYREDGVYVKERQAVPMSGNPRSSKLVVKRIAIP